MFLIEISVSYNLVETLFRDKIQTGQCISRCQSTESHQDQLQCLSTCQALFSRPGDDLCSVTSVCSGGCAVACEKQSNKQHIVISNIGLDQCTLSWSLETVEARNLVFIVVGKDVGGKWNLISDQVMETTTQLSYRDADKMEELMILAVDAAGVGDSISVDISNNHCHHDVPEPVQWVEEESVEMIMVDRETSIKEGTSITATVVLSLLAIFTILVIIAIISVRLSQSRNNTNDNRSTTVFQVAASKVYEVPELPYSPQVRSFTDVKNINKQLNIVSEKLLKPRVIDIESDEYEVVEVTPQHTPDSSC